MMTSDSPTDSMADGPHLHQISRIRVFRQASRSTRDRASSFIFPVSFLDLVVSSD
jgi:hypothetical protein